MTDTDTEKICIAEGCKQKWHCRRLCSPHYTRAKHAGNLPPIIQPHASTKLCVVTHCHNKKKGYGICATHLDRKKAGWPDWDTRPVAKKIMVGGAWAEYEPWQADVYRHYGLKKEEYARLFKAQNGVCAICSGECSTGRRLSVDHDHDTGHVRGLLCGNCNQGIGKLGDCPKLLRKAADYLESPTNQID